jgi:hypothetical protein
MPSTLGVTKDPGLICDTLRLDAYELFTSTVAPCGAHWHEQ